MRLVGNQWVMVLPDDAHELLMWGEIPTGNYNKL